MRHIITLTLAILAALLLGAAAGCKPSPSGAQASGGASAASANPPAPQAAVPGQTAAQSAPFTGTIVAEAEKYERIEKPMIVATDKDKDAENGQVTFVWCPEGPGCEDISLGPDNKPLGFVELKIRVPKAGKYWFWARTWSHCTCGNECRIILKKGAVTLFNLKLNQPTTGVWQWLRKPGAEADSAVELEAGDYELIIHNYEDGMRIDKVLFTLDPPSQFVPVGPNP